MSNFARMTFAKLIRLGKMLLLVTCIAGNCAADPLKADMPQPSLDKRWMGKHNYLTSLVLQASRRPPLDIYFLGDSITEFWPELGKDVWQAEFGNLRILNCGVSGDTTQNMIYRITHGEFDRIAPKLVIVLAGTNNLGLDPKLEPEELARGLKRITSIIRAKSPVSKILLLSIFPSSPAPTAPIRSRIQETNKRIAALSDDSVVFYLDLYPAFLDTEGNLPTSVSPDGTHLSARGYQIWADAMRPTLHKLLE